MNIEAQSRSELDVEEISGLDLQNNLNQLSCTWSRGSAAAGDCTNSVWQGSAMGRTAMHVLETRQERHFGIVISKWCESMSWYPGRSARIWTSTTPPVPDIAPTTVEHHCCEFVDTVR